MIIVTDQNGQSAKMHAHPVGVACNTCGRRGAVPLETVMAKCSMERLKSRRWVCFGCHGTDVELALYLRLRPGRGVGG